MFGLPATENPATPSGQVSVNSAANLPLGTVKWTHACSLGYTVSVRNPGRYQVN
jgi:hypothetical protein